MVLLCSKWWKLMGSQSWATSWPVIGVNPQWREDIPTLHTEASQNRKNSWESGNIIFILQHPGKTFPSFCGKPFGFFRHRTSTEAPLEAKNAMLPVRSAWWDWWAWRSHPTWWLAARWPLGANRRHPKINESDVRLHCQCFFFWLSLRGSPIVWKLWCTVMPIELNFSEWRLSEARNQHLNVARVWKIDPLKWAVTHHWCIDSWLLGVSCCWTQNAVFFSEISLTR